MNWNLLIRQAHRWISILFVAIVVALFAAMGMGKTPPPWVYFLPLIPLFLLAVSGLYLFALPYLVKDREQAR